MKRARIFYLVLIAAAMALGGCGSNPKWETQSFAFAAPTGSPPANVRTNLVALGRVTISPLFQSRSFTYRTGQDAYEQDPYAVFIVSPEAALAETIRGRLRSEGTFGHVIEEGSRLAPSVMVEAAVNELDGDFREPSKPIAEMAIHFIVYDDGPEGPGHVVLDKVCAGRTPLKGRTPAALMAGWDEDLREIMDEIDSEYAKTHLNDR